MAVTIPGVPTFNASMASSPAMDGFAVTPSNATNFNAWARGLYIGGAGNVVLVTPGGTQLTFVGLVAGQILPVACGRVNSTNTTATNIVALI